MVLLAPLAVVAGLYIFFDLRFRKWTLWPLALVLSLTVFIGRLDKGYALYLGDRPILGFPLYVTALSLLLYLIAAPRHRARALPLPVALPLGIFTLLSLVSGLVNAGPPGLTDAIQVLMITLPPVLLAGLFTSVIGGVENGARETPRILILALGVVTPMFMVLTAVFADVFGKLIGWQPVVTEMGAGFARGWAPVGNPIVAGALVAVAFGLTLGPLARGGRRTAYAAVVMLCLMAVGVSLSRAVLIMYFSIGLFFVLQTRLRGLRLVLPILAAFALLLGFAQMKGYSFDRFMRTDDHSMQIRLQSTAIAWDESRRSPLLGAGPGQLYDVPRIWLKDFTDAPKDMVIDGRLSATEPHNLYLWIAAEHGWPALIAFLAAIFNLYRPLLRLRLPEDDPRRIDRAALISIWLALMFYFFTHSDLVHYPKFSAFFWILGFHAYRWARAQAPAGQSVLE